MNQSGGARQPTASSGPPFSAWTIKMEVDANQQRFSSLRLRNVLSFGPDSGLIKLAGLNVLIGANASGKSNLIDAIDFLRRSPKSIQEALRAGGGSSEYVWKGTTDQVKTFAIQASIVAGISEGCRFGHELKMAVFSQQALVNKERVALLSGLEDSQYVEDGDPNIVLFDLDGGRAMIRDRGQYRKIGNKLHDERESILSQRKDQESFNELFFLSSFYSRIAIYREWRFGRDTILRLPQRADLPNDQLLDDFSNLGLFLNHLSTQPKAKRAVLDGMRDLYDYFTDFGVKIESNSVQVFFHEGDRLIPATRLSDGTLRYLCLLAILCNPNPPPVICIEEPELGLHPDILPKLADKLIEASQKSQLFITTHSDILVDALSDRPESVVVCENAEGQTRLKRLDKADLAVWLEKYRLGELWTQGHLGGNRW